MFKMAPELVVFLLLACINFAFAEEEDNCKIYVENMLKVYSEMVHNDTIPKCLYEVAEKFDWPKDLETKDPKYIELIRKQFIKMKDEVKDKTVVCLKKTVEMIMEQMTVKANEDCMETLRDGLDSVKEYFQYNKRV